MKLFLLQPLHLLSVILRPWRQYLLILLLTLVTNLFLLGTPPASANIDDDKYDGNIFVLYAGNGSLVPPRLTLAQSLKRNKPAILVYYVDDSRDCKEFSIVVSRLQEYYGRAASFIPVDVDSIPIKSSYDPSEEGYYYEGVVPQTVILDQDGKVVLNEKGQAKFEAIDDVLREVFNLLPRSQSAELKRRSFNEFNTELSE